MNKCIITIGPSATGKTTWAKDYCKHNNAIRINRDDLRSSLFGLTLREYFDSFDKNKDKEEIITSLVYKMANEAIKQGKDIVMDNTHLQLKYIKDTVKNIHGNVKFDVCWFGDPDKIDLYIQRDYKRETSVGENVIRKQFQQFDKIWKNAYDVSKILEGRHKENFTPVKQNIQLPFAFIFDIDGTVAKMGDRSPYDYTKVIKDEINQSVAWINNLIKDGNEQIKIIICTGRDGRAEGDTKKWLEEHIIYYDDFYIRKAGDNRKDAIVKREFLEDIIKKYYVICAFDDRDQVVDMWRQSGIDCFQVDYGDF